MLKVGVNSGIEMHRWLTDLFPINRSITGQGVRETLSYLKNILPDLNIISVASGEKVFDWDVPEEWVINEAWIKDSEGNVVVDFSKSNLHVVNYSTAIDEKLSFSELSKHLYFIKEQPSLIPYVTSYYKKHWGFCIEYERFKKLDKSQTYHAYIDAEHIYGELNYAELVIKGKSDKEMLISSYVCHPSMANNELSGPVVLTQLAKYWCLKLSERLHICLRICPLLK